MWEHNDINSWLINSFDPQTVFENNDFYAVLFMLVLVFRQLFYILCGQVGFSVSVGFPTLRKHFYLF